MHSEEKGVVPVFDLADRMSKALREGRVSVAEMAEYLGVHRNTLGRYLSGASAPKRQTLRLWALRTGVPFKWLETGAEPEPLRPGPTSDECAIKDSNLEPTDLEHSPVASVVALRPTRAVAA